MTGPWRAVSGAILLAAAFLGAGPGPRSADPRLVPRPRAVPSSAASPVAGAPGKPSRSGPGSAEDSIATIIRERLGGTAVADSVPALSLDALRRFYGGREYAPAWLAQPIAQASLLGALRAAAEQGLDPRAYHLTMIESRVPLASDAGARLLAETDLLLSDAYLAFATHRAIGRLDPRTFLAGWRDPSRPFDAVASLEAALDSLGPARALEAGDPTGHRFRELRAALIALRDSLPWGTVPAGPSLAPGDSGSRVAALRRRLEPGAALDTGVQARFDDRLAELVRDFQAHHGLEEDGVAGRRTIAAMNVPLETRLRQIELAMERVRWLPPPAAGRRIEVLVPAFELKLYEDDRTSFETRVIGGLRDWPTPSLTSEITEIVVNPYWNVPSRIVALEILPEVIQDPRYLARNDMEILSREGTRIPVGAIDWARVDPWDFNYRIRQRPGPVNPLGRVKFVFDNPFDVYLHDTPAQAAFARADRSMSHGCVRVRSALDLAMLVMEGAPSWNRATLDSLIATGTQQSVRTPRPVPVEIIYLTAWVGYDGRLQYRDDIYGLDADLVTRLADPSQLARAEAMSGDCVTQ